MTTAASLISSTNTPPTPPSPRFTLELEFVLSLSNPYYLSHLALTYPQLLNPPPQDTRSSFLFPSNPSQKPPSSSTTSHPEPQPGPESDASKFASYLAYLYNYWRKPEYARFLTHPGATLRNLKLLQQEQFRRDVIRPDVIEKLLVVGTEDEDEVEDAAAAVAAEGGGEVKEGMERRGKDDTATDSATAAGEQEAKIKQEGEEKDTEGQGESAMDITVG